MLFVSTAEDFANPLGELISTEQPLSLNYLAFAVNPLGLYRVEPGALGGQQTRHYSDSMAAGFDTAVVGADPASDLMAFMPACVVQIRSRASLPLCLSLWQHQERNCVVMELTGRPSTNLSQVSLSSPADKARSRRVLWARDRPFWLPSRGGGPALWHPPRNAQKVARSEKTSSRPRNPEPTPDGSRPAGSADLDPLFSGILRIGAFYPAFGPLPAHPQS